MAMIHAELALEAECQNWARAARTASRPLAVTPGAARNEWLLHSASALIEQADAVRGANEEDRAKAVAAGLDAAALDRLTLTPARIEGMARALREVAALPDPIGEVIAGERRPNGLEVARIRAPLGVLFMIYESRPNVTVDAAALAIKAGNAVILRGGKEALRSNRILARILADNLEPCGLPTAALQLVPTTDRAAVGHLLACRDFIDLTIPRGGKDLIRRVAAEARMPVLKHLDGNCHIFVDRSADLAMAEAIILDAKVSRPGVCNAVETILIHSEVAEAFLPQLGSMLRSHRVEIRGDEATCTLIPEAVPATAEDWDAEYLDLIVAVRVVPDATAAIVHINRHGSMHTDAIVTADRATARRFVAEVDSAAVVVNASTRFNDGGQLGLGAEIGISTDKFHARGPCGLRELTTSKWIIQGDGQVRS